MYFCSHLFITSDKCRVRELTESAPSRYHVILEIKLKSLDLAPRAGLYHLSYFTSAGFAFLKNSYFELLYVFIHRSVPVSAVSVDVRGWFWILWNASVIGSYELPEVGIED